MVLTIYITKLPHGVWVWVAPRRTSERLLLTVGHLRKARENGLPCLCVVGPYHDMWLAMKQMTGDRGVTYVRIIIQLINYSIVMTIWCYVADMLQ
jgi:hypothetical protein